MDPTSLMLPSFVSLEGVATHRYDTLEYWCNESRGLFCTEESLPSFFGEPIHWTNWDGQEYVLIDRASASRLV